MSYCPKCGTEYREGFQKCADCDTELVMELPEHTKQPANVKKKAAYIISFITIYVLTVMVFAFLHRNSTDELATLNKNYDIMAKRAADSIAENDKLKQENSSLKSQLRTANSVSTQGSRLIPDTDVYGVEDVIAIQKLEYKNLNNRGFKGRVAQLEITINNLTNREFPVNSIKFKAITNQHRTVPRSTEALVSYESTTNSKVGFELVDLEPSTKAEGTIFFELKNGESIIKLMYGDLEILIKK